MGRILVRYRPGPSNLSRKSLAPAALTLACSRHSPTFVFFILAQFHLGIRLTPGAKAETGFFDAEKVVAALRRGSEMSKDLTDYDWDYWKGLKRPLAEPRAEWRVPPR